MSEFRQCSKRYSAVHGVQSVSEAAYHCGCRNMTNTQLDSSLTLQSLACYHYNTVNAKSCINLEVLK